MSAHPEPVITADAMAIVLAAIDPAAMDDVGRERLDAVRRRAAAGEPAERIWRDLIAMTHRIPFGDLKEVWNRIGDSTEAERTAEHRFTWDIWDWRAESALMDDPS